MNFAKLKEGEKLVQRFTRDKVDYEVTLSVGEVQSNFVYISMDGFEPDTLPRTRVASIVKHSLSIIVAAHFEVPAEYVVCEYSNPWGRFRFENSFVATQPHALKTNS